MSEEKDASAASDTTAPQGSGACCAFDEDIPSCGKCPGAGHHMVVPNNRKAVDRLLSHIPPQLICFQRRGYREWRSKYGLFSMREKPLLCNENWQGDHHIFDIFVRIPIHRIKNGKTYVREIAIRPVLTA